MNNFWFVAVLVCLIAYVEGKPFYFHLSFSPKGTPYSTPCDPYGNSYSSRCMSYSQPCNSYPNYPTQYGPNQPSPCNPNYPPINQQPDSQNPTKYGLLPQQPVDGNRPSRSNTRQWGRRRRQRTRAPPPYGSRFLARPDGYNSGRHDDPFPSDFEENPYREDQGEADDEYEDENYEDDYDGHQDDY